MWYRTIKEQVEMYLAKSPSTGGYLVTIILESLGTLIMIGSFLLGLNLGILGYKLLISPYGLLGDFLSLIVVIFIATLLVLFMGNPINNKLLEIKSELYETYSLSSQLNSVIIMSSSLLLMVPVLAFLLSWLILIMDFL